MLANFAWAALLCAGAQATTINTNLKVTVTGTVGTSTTITLTGQATLDNIGSGLLTTSVDLTKITGATVTVPYTITLSGGSGTLTGNITFPPSLISGQPGSGSATVTGGTGSYAGATGSFPNLSGTGSLSGTTISVTFSGAGTITTGGTPPPPSNAPTITEVSDAATYTKNIAQGSIFIVKGSNLGGSGYNPMSFPLPTTSGGIKITFTPTSGGAGTDAYLIYLYNQGGVNQLAAILPSTVATGSYNVTVTNGSVSSPFATQVVQRKFALITQDSSGTGLGVVQNIVSATQYDVNRFTTGTINGITISPAKPGQGLIAYATGLGPITTGDNSGAPALDVTSAANVKVLVGGTSITPVYSGRTPGAAGLDQVSFILPSNVPTGCAISFQVSVNGVLSNTTFIAIAPDASSTACVMPGFTTQQLTAFDNGQTYTTGNFSISQIAFSDPSLGNFKIDTAGGDFTRYTGFQLAALAQSQYAITTSTQGACTVIHVVGKASQGQVLNLPSPVSLDAGAVTLNGPTASKISNQALTQDPTSNDYSLTIAYEGLNIPGLGGCSGCTITAGTYTLNGAGGKDVGKFNVSITLGTPLTVTGGLPSTVTRSAGLPLAWTGGNASDLVQIVGYSGTTTGTGTNAVIDATEFICATTAGPGGFTVPASVLTQLPAVNASATNASGILMVSSSVAPVSLRPPLTAGGSIDSGSFTATVGIAGLASYQ